MYITEARWQCILLRPGSILLAVYITEARWQYITEARWQCILLRQVAVYY